MIRGGDTRPKCRRRASAGASAAPPTAQRSTLPQAVGDSEGSSFRAVSSIPLLDILKVQRMRDDPSSFAVYFQHGRHRLYWCDKRDELIKAIGTNLASKLFVSLRVEDADSSWEYDALTATRDERTPVLFEMPVYKISKTLPATPRERLLGLTASALLEREPVTGRTVSTIALS